MHQAPDATPTNKYAEVRPIYRLNRKESPEELSFTLDEDNATPKDNNRLNQSQKTRLQQIFSKASFKLIGSCVVGVCVGITGTYLWYKHNDPNCDGGNNSAFPIDHQIYPDDHNISIWMIGKIPDSVFNLLYTAADGCMIIKNVTINSLSNGIRSENADYYFRKNFYTENFTEYVTEIFQNCTLPMLTTNGTQP